MKALVRRILPGPYDRLTAYVVAKHTMLVGEPTAQHEEAHTQVWAQGAGYYAIPRAYVHGRTLAIGLLVPLVVVWLGGAGWGGLGVWWGLILVGALQLGGTIREVLVHGTSVLPRRLVWQPLRLAVGLVVPAGVVLGPLWALLTGVAWAVVYVATLSRAD